MFWETAAASPDVCDWKHDHDGLGATAIGTYLRRRSKLEARHSTPGRLRIVVGDTSPGAVSFAWNGAQLIVATEKTGLHAGASLRRLGPVLAGQYT